MNKKGTLYLIPVGMGNNDAQRIIPAFNSSIINELKHFVTENGKTARAFLKATVEGIVLQELNYYELNQHTKQEELASYLTLLLDGNDVGLMSEAGCPGIADPGADLVKLAHKNSIRVVPLVGPSSILLTIMASGLNGQNFAFNGYLPKDKNDRIKKIKELEKLCFSKQQSQYFIETPYRNSQLISELLHTLSPATYLIIASSITTAEESIVMRSVAEWKKLTPPNFDKKPCMFGIGI
jgi:16S rRNA (cytidine1402-2'-O)-methyltransferase